MLKAYSLARFDRIAEASLFCSVPTDPGQINPRYDQLLAAGVEKTVQFLGDSLVHASAQYREEAISEMRLKLNGRRRRWISVAKRRHLDRQPVPSLANAAEPFRITREIIKRRRGILADYRQKHGALTVADFARHVGSSVTAIEGIVKEDRKRYSVATRDKLLEKLGVSVEDWNRDQ
jgi:hypothetical protein